MKIAVLDAYTLNPGDLSWAELEKLGDVSVYDRSPGTELLIERAVDAEIVITNKIYFDTDRMAQLPKLKYIAVSATGYNIVDVEAARERGIIVSNVPAYSTHEVAQHSIALLLALTNQVSIHAQSTGKGEWSKQADWSYMLAPLSSLHGKTMGILGPGKIGQATAAIARAMGMKTIAYRRNQQAQLDGVQIVELETLFRESDVLSLHAPLTPETNLVVNADRLLLMKKTALLINTSRGPLIDEAALAEALKSGQIAGAALDVLSSEPPIEGNPLVGLPNCIITPHIAWAAYESRARLMGVLTENIKTYLEGNPQNVVS